MLPPSLTCQSSRRAVNLVVLPEPYQHQHQHQYQYQQHQHQHSAFPSPTLSQAHHRLSWPAIWGKVPGTKLPLTRDVPTANDQTLPGIAAH